MDGSGSHTSQDTIEQSSLGSSVRANNPLRHASRRSRLTILVALIMATIATLAAIVTDTAGAAGSGAGAATTSPQTLPAVQTVAFDVSATLANGPTTTTLLTGNGAADLTNGEGTTTLTVPALSGLLGSNDTVTALWQGTNLYLQVPALSGFLGGKSWAEVSLAGIPGISSLGSTVQSYLSDPSKLAGVVTSLGGTVTDLGPQPNGTTEYQATIPVRRDRLRRPAPRAPARQQGKQGEGVLDQTLRQGPPSPGHLDHHRRCVGGKNGQLTQVSVTVDLGHATAARGVTLPGGLAGGVLTVTVGLSYGAPVSVTIPPASDVDNLGNVLPLLQSLGHLGSLPGLAARI